MFVRVPNNPFAPTGEDAFLELDESDDEIAELARNPAWREIVAAAWELERLGFKLSDPGMWDRAVACGERDHADHQQWAAQSKARREISAHDSVVYYMALGHLVKIGTSTNLTERSKALNPQGILAIEFGGYDRESARHKEFAEQHEHGEWFRNEGALAAHIQRLRTDVETATGQPFAEWLPGALPVRTKKVTRATAEFVELEHPA